MARIVTFTEFAELPEGTVFSHYRPMIASGLYAKGETYRNDKGEPIDFYERSLEAAPDEQFENMLVDDCEIRWGMFQRDALFLVYSPDELRLMIETLQTALNLKG